ncbi:MAG: nucleoside hydrolase [Chloroflexi bacterium]|nr:nucleoside hydrolase [Chloroflexota bacterium]MCL5076367.1 nucleoside hydrolase [Chloroflexota bacterium]
MKRVIIDTDPGIDDTAAIFFALSSGQLQVEALTTVYGNVEIEQCSRNALKVLEVAGRSDIPVYQGAARPLLKEPRYGKRVHGDDGLGDVSFAPPHSCLAPGRAAEQIITRIMEAPGEITVIALGPLTNLALAVSLEPQIAQNVREVIYMGGAIFAMGNATPVASANMYNDPEAAYIVCESGMPLTQIGLDVCEHCYVTEEQMAVIGAAHTPMTDFLTAISRKHMLGERQGYIGAEGYTLYGAGPWMHFNDVPAVAYALDPTLFTVKKLYLTVETKGMITYGQTVADFRGRLGKPPNVNVCLKVDGRRLVDRFVECLARGSGGAGRSA